MYVVTVLVTGILLHCTVTVTTASEKMLPGHRGVGDSPRSMDSGIMMYQEYQVFRVFTKYPRIHRARLVSSDVTYW